MAQFHIMGNASIAFFNLLWTFMKWSIGSTFYAHEMCYDTLLYCQ